MRILVFLLCLLAVALAIPAHAVRWQPSGSEKELLLSKGVGGLVLLRNRAGKIHRATRTEMSKSALIFSLNSEAQAGDAGAVFGLAVAHEMGHGVPKNLPVAMELYEKAGEMGLAAAYNNLGEIYRKGKHVEADPNKAMELYQLAAEWGDAWAQNNLGLLYLHGIGVEKDPKLAYYWVKGAATAGLMQGVENLAGLYRDGIGVERDAMRSRALYRKAISLGPLMHMCRLESFWRMGMAARPTLLEPFGTIALLRMPDIGWGTITLARFMRMVLALNRTWNWLFIIMKELRGRGWLGLSLRWAGSTCLGRGPDPT